LYYFHRWYDPSIGRFISPDPKQGKLSNPQSLNLYIYVFERPTSLEDPSGLDWWNPLSWTPAQQFTAVVDVVAVVAVVATVLTFGATAPLAAAAIGAAIGASTSTTAYTIGAGDKATLGGVALSALTGAVAGAIGGYAGGLAVNFVKAEGSLAVGMLAAGAGQAIGSQAGHLLGSFAGGSQFKVDPLAVATDFGVGAVTFGLGGKLGAFGDRENIAANRVFGAGQQSLFRYIPYSDTYDSPFVTAYYAETGFVAGEQGAYELGSHIVRAISSYLT